MVLIKLIKLLSLITVWNLEHCLIKLIASEKKVYSRIHIRIRHPIFAIRIVFVTWCIRYSPRHNSKKIFDRFPYKLSQLFRSKKSLMDVNWRVKFEKNLRWVILRKSQNMESPISFRLLIYAQRIYKHYMSHNALRHVLGVCADWAYLWSVDQQSRSHLWRLPHVIWLLRPCHGALRCSDESLEVNKDIFVWVSSPSPEYHSRLSSDPSFPTFLPCPSFPSFSLVLDIPILCVFYVRQFATNIKMQRMSELCVNFVVSIKTSQILPQFYVQS